MTFRMPQLAVTLSGAAIGLALAVAPVAAQSVIVPSEFAVAEPEPVPVAAPLPPSRSAAAPGRPVRRVAAAPATPARTVPASVRVAYVDPMTASRAGMFSQMWIRPSMHFIGVSY